MPEPITSQYQSENPKPAPSANATQQVRVGPITIGDGRFTLIAGPCAVESEAQFLEIAQAVAQAGAVMLRGGIFKMRTNPNSFQGLGAEAFDIVREVKSQTGMPLVSEITDPRQIEELGDIVDMFQVGSRNMYNYSLLKELGRCGRPVLLKRGLSALIDEWLHAAEYVTNAGNSQVVLCERGIRTFETKTRNTLDLNAVAYVKAHTSFPILVDPSHGTGRPELIPPLTRAAAAMGADGVIIEVHPRPQEAKSDGFQALKFDQFNKLTDDLKRLVELVTLGVES